MSANEISAAVRAPGTEEKDIDTWGCFRRRLVDETLFHYVLNHLISLSFPIVALAHFSYFLYLTVIADSSLFHGDSCRSFNRL